MQEGEKVMREGEKLVRGSGRPASGGKLTSLQPDALGGRLLEADNGKAVFDATPHRVGRAEVLVGQRKRSLLEGPLHTAQERSPMARSRRA
jgi:hypothetical protein